MPPTIDRTSIEAKLKGLREQLVQLQANANAVNGAILFAESLLSEIIQPQIQDPLAPTPPTEA